MPHYRNGTEAQVGDLVRGTTYNRNKMEIVGTIISITPGVESCNCLVAFARVVKLPAFTGPTKNWVELFGDLKFMPAITYAKDGTMAAIVGDYDYTETRALELIARSTMAESPTAEAAQAAE